VLSFCLIYLIINYSGVVFLLCRYNGDAVIKMKVNGISAGIKHISVSINRFGDNVVDCGIKMLCR